MTETLQNITGRYAIPPEMAESLRAIMIKRHYKRGEVIQASISLLANAYYITKGMARAYYIKNGREHTYTFVFEDEVIAIPRSLFKIKDIVPAIEFLEDSDVLEISHDRMQDVMTIYSKEHLTDLASFIIDRLLEHARIVEERLLVFQSMDAAERYEWFIQMYPTILERANITQIASFLGVTKETLYRIRAGKYKQKR